MSLPSIDMMFDPAHFRSCGHALIDLLAAQLEQQLDGDGPVLDWRDPKCEEQRWQQPLPRRPILDSETLLQRLSNDILPGALAIHHPHNLGHQVATPLPLAALCDLVAALSNQAMAVYETGPSATMLERQVLRWLAELIGWHGTAVHGVLTSGGNQANLTALLAARQQASPAAWQQGLAASAPLRILASEHSHYSIARAAAIMGLGSEAVIKVAADDSGRMRLDALQQAHQDCQASCLQVMAVVANAGCTPTGSIDPLEAIASYCREHSLWLHIDGAHGASALLSARHRDQLQGIDLADSIVWDGHKLLYMPATVSAVLFRDPRHSHAAFAQDASYLFQPGEIENFNVSTRTLECTKRMMGLKLWAAFSLYGIDGLAQLVDQVFASAALLAEKLAADTAFELLMRPQTNIVCFRHLLSDATVSASNRHQAGIRLALVRGGEFHLTQVELHGELWLRTTIMNPFTGASDFDQLLACIKHQASVLVNKPA